MNNLSWPMAMVLAVLVVCASVLGVTHVLDSAWIERTFSALLGFAVGMGVRQKLPSTPAPSSGNAVAPPSVPTAPVKGP